MNTTFILENLAIGDFQEALNPPSEISALLCVAQEKEIGETPLYYHKVPIIDMQPIPEAQLQAAVEWIKVHINTHKIMVFCNAGIGRSPSVVVGYLCCVLGYGFGEAVELVAKKRPYMSTLPNLIKTIEAVTFS
ncbi:MAG: hypothetical protein DRR08_28590 [Candidatus Parabeggiatoa sp. nov. 2]|nr:MAG: hypothetical protein B6247_30920 [Beggiatoa sp. 4572_84]RKZ52147.1 MAG: hypothetical protein DRR08_28590 [Gammaproteobacteria bacterium]